LELWVLTHPDLRIAARVSAMMKFLYDELGSKTDLWGGERKTPDGGIFIAREST
jgi:hypothetical protein